MTDPTLDLDRAIVDARRASMRTMWVVTVGVLVLAVATVAAVWFAASGRSAAQDSFNATSVQLATQERSACITERRNTQSDALGRLTIAANNAEAAGLIDQDPDEVMKQRRLYDQAVADWAAATESLGAAVLNQPKPKGCGAPILTIDDLEDQ